MLVCVPRLSLAPSAGRMAGVAVGAIPHIIADPGMLPVGLRLRVAVGTHKNCEIRLIRVAVGAQGSGAVRDREPRVIEHRA